MIDTAEIPAAPIAPAPVDLPGAPMQRPDADALPLTFDEYVRLSGPRLKRLAYLLTGDLDSAEDLLQTAYAKVLPRWRTIAGYEDPDGYMRRVMVNTRTSWWRRRGGREVSTGEIHDGGVPTAGEARDHAADQAALDAVLRALRTLPRRQQVAVVLRHYCDLSETETASVMQISVGGVKSQTSKGLAALRTAMAAGTREEAER